MIRLLILLFFLPFNANAADFGDLLNAKRAAASQHALVPSQRLKRAAEAHALDLARSGRFSHRSTDGSRLKDRVKRQGYKLCYAAENIAKGQDTQTEVLNAWLRSRGHRKNALSPKAREYGFARAKGDIWVLVVGRRC